jgi:hypothetical protein
MRKLLVIAVLLMVMGIGIVAWREHMSAQKSPFAVALRVGGGNEQTITEPAPLLLAVFVSKTIEAANARIGAADRPWYSNIVIEPVDAAGTPPLRWALLARPRSVYVRHDPGEKRTGLEMYDGGEAVFDETRRVCTAEFGVAPEDVARIAPGRHAYQAVLVSESWLPWHWHGRATSAPIWVTVKGATALDPARETAESTPLAQSARFYFRAGRFDDSLRTAQALVLRSPTNASYRILLGDALNGLRRDTAALNEYREALLLLSSEEQHGHHDAPEYLFMRIKEVRERIKQTEPPKK